MKKILLFLFSILFIQNVCMAKDAVVFEFPNSGWHKVASPDGLESKKCYVPVNQTSENYNEMLIFTQRVLQNKDISPMTILHKQLGKDRTNYPDIEPTYIKNDTDNPMVTWCSAMKNTCAVERAFMGNDGVILIFYINKMPHYSQNMFGQWSNILSTVKLYDSTENEQTKTVIQL